LSKLFLTFCFILIAQTLEAKSLPQRLREDFAGILKLSSKVERDEAFLLFTSILGLSLMDEEVRRFITDNRNQTLTCVSKFVKPYGGKYLPLGICTLSYLYGKLSGNRYAEETALLGAEACLFAGLITGGLQILVGRKRPREGKGAYSFIGPHIRGGAGGKSFPSGHATVAFALSTVFAERAENRLIDFLLYGIASATALSRVYDDAHWASDVFAGAAIGIFVGRALVYLHEGRKD
jgi:membrane-associated phospholipid phosphatase